MSQPTGLEGFAQGAGALQQQAQGLRAAVDSGQVVMDHAAAERVAKVYEDKARAVKDEIDDAFQLVVNGAYGNCFIGKQMDQKMADKVNHPETGLVAILRQMEQTLRDMAQAYRDSAREMQNADEEAGHAGRRV